MTTDERQIIIALNSFLSSPTVKYIETKFKRNKREISVDEIIEIDEVELFENLGQQKAVEFIHFQTQLKQNKHN